MTYVASPSYDRNDASRASNLRQCLDTARRHLNETAHSSETEKIETLVASAIEAGWEEDEVREALSAGVEHGNKMPEQELPVPTIGVVSSSSF
ncbi:MULTISPECIES: hypothetical protein [unclassified Rhizobium]|uniref:hypothetical protein n=1 Tax=unclassified Rhizobium TaxID=2613769 RepID=UPI0007EB0951|nr:MULTISPECIES: hypothetical protein [unclassified Rhizobium]ANM14079.1 hypothetical protein AMK05_PD00182 [Rhizobium sp. N324]ANM20461.1 hypothetical protein AMK06_PD00182 [Rhizobium sp. N541]ANM26845.1 hypothetical protein AMK07_PD00182 [Rhizobium sp. N941]OYD00252.1 hypothetical protein AMK08_PD00182 [Rhizobium sp. N4311]